MKKSRRPREAAPVFPRTDVGGLWHAGAAGVGKWMDSKGVWDVDVPFLAVDAEGQGSSKAGTGEGQGMWRPQRKGTLKMTVSVLGTSMNACLPCCS